MIIFDLHIPVLIIIIILCLDLYYTYSDRFGKKNNEKFDNENNEDEIIFDEPNPWNKIQYFAHINKYYIKINNINEHIEKIMLWKSLPVIKSDLIDIDVENNYLILKTNSEEEALVVCNLIINHINNNLTINDIISKNLINYSINKAKRFKLIGIKLTELIKEGIIELNTENKEDMHLEEIDMDDIDKQIEKKKKKKLKLINKLKLNDTPNDTNNSTNLFTNINNNNIKEIKSDLFDRITPYEGSEYATIKF
jgi:hypothetical protein